MYNIYIYIYHFIISLGRNFLMFLSTVSSPYASKTARVYAVTASIFYCLSVARGFAATSLLFPVGCRRPRQSAGHGGECAVEADVLPLPPRRGVCSESMVEFVCVTENVDVVAQQSMASVPTCSDSKTRKE